jgi:hypothetical protein
MASDVTPRNTLTPNTGWVVCSMLVKLQHGDDLRRWTVKAEETADGEPMPQLSIATIERKVRELFDLRSPVSLCYVDNDGETVTLEVCTLPHSPPARNLR